MAEKIVPAPSTSLCRELHGKARITSDSCSALHPSPAHIPQCLPRRSSSSTCFRDTCRASRERLRMDQPAAPHLHVLRSYSPPEIQFTQSIYLNRAESFRMGNTQLCSATEPASAPIWAPYPISEGSALPVRRANPYVLRRQLPCRAALNRLPHLRVCQGTRTAAWPLQRQLLPALRYSPGPSSGLPPCARSLPWLSSFLLRSCPWPLSCAP